MKCVVIRPPAKDACGADATCRVDFRDMLGRTHSQAPACRTCALYLQQVASNNYSAAVAVEPIR